MDVLDLTFSDDEEEEEEKHSRRRQVKQKKKQPKAVRTKRKKTSHRDADSEVVDLSIDDDKEAAQPRRKEAAPATKSGSSSSSSSSSSSKAGSWVYPDLRLPSRAVMKSAKVQTQLAHFRLHADAVVPAAAYACHNVFWGKGPPLPFACKFKSDAKSGWAFSNFFETPVTLHVRGAGLNDLYTFPSSEHAYQWSVRVFPIDATLKTLLKWCVGGEYTRLETKKKQGVGYRAKMLVGSKTPLRLYPPAMSRGVSLAALFSRVWRPILLAKFTQNLRLHEALKETGARMLVEWSKAYNRGTHGGYVKADGKHPFRIPARHAAVLTKPWRMSVWSGNLIQKPGTRTVYAFGFNVMGDFLMQIRQQIFGGPAVRWPNQLASAQGKAVVKEWRKAV
jgi:hypothetical protein